MTAGGPEDRVTRRPITLNTFALIATVDRGRAPVSGYIMLPIPEIVDLPRGARFFRADLHIHSCTGRNDVRDAATTPEAIVTITDQEGLRIVAITDHNKIAASPPDWQRQLRSTFWSLLQSNSLPLKGTCFVTCPITTRCSGSTRNSKSRAEIALPECHT